MDFELSDEQQALGDTVRALLDKAYGSVEQRIAVGDTDRGWSPDVWRSAADLGVLGLPFAESSGGMGAGPVEVMAVQLEVGRVLAPEPFLDGAFLPGAVLEAAGAPDQVQDLMPSLVDGSRLFALAHEEPGSRWPDIEVRTTSEMEGGGTTLSGTKYPVANGDCADVFLVSARDQDGALGLYVVEATAAGLSRAPYRTNDERRGAQVVLDRTPAVRLTGGDAQAALADAYVRGQAAQCAEAIGAMREALRVTVEYLTQRTQFGRPLASFQALQHRAADLFEAIESANSSMLMLTATLDDGVVDPVLASRAKVQVGRAATKVGQECVQMHGGIGITHEAPISHFHSRLIAVAHTLGATDDHLRVLAAQVAAG